MLDAFVALAVGYFTSAVTLMLFAVVTPGMPADEVIGKIALQAVPASMGALLAQSQLAGQQQEQENNKRRSSYFRRNILMASGASFSHSESLLSGRNFAVINGF